MTPKFKGVSANSCQGFFRLCSITRHVSDDLRCALKFIEIRDKEDDKDFIFEIMYFSELKPKFHLNFLKSFP